MISCICIYCFFIGIVDVFLAIRYRLEFGLPIQMLYELLAKPSVITIIKALIKSMVFSSPSLLDSLERLSMFFHGNSSILDFSPVDLNLGNFR
jgi:hypothetical protein